MSRYIEADVLKANRDIVVGDTTIGIRDYVTFREIDSAPSIDIVFCKECKHRKKNSFCLEHNRYEKNDNGYCSYGVRLE